MKKALKIVGIVIGGFFLLTIMLAIVGAFLTDSDDSKITHSTIEISEADKKKSDSLRLEEKRIIDSIKTAREKEAIAKKAQAQEDIKKFNKNFDEFENTSFYKDPRAPKYANVNFIYPYIGEKDGHYWLRLKMQYAADDWLFINRVRIKTDTGQYEFSGNFERDHNSGIWEWTDILVGKDEHYMMRDMALSSEVLVRYEGRQYAKDRKLTAKEKNVIKTTLALYDALK